jgi:hypothetical protein
MCVWVSEARAILSRGVQLAIMQRLLDDKQKWSARCYAVYSRTYLEER